MDPEFRPAPATRSPRLRRLAALSGAVFVAAGLAVAVAAPAQAAPVVKSTSSATATSTATAVAATSTSSSCNVATASTTALAKELCWLDLSGYSATEATQPAGQPFSVRVAGGYTLSFTLNVSGGAVHATPLGDYADAYLGTHGVVTGVTGRPALSQTTQTTTTMTTLSKLRLVDAAGQKVSSFDLVAADAESTDAGESLVFSSNVALASTKFAPIGDACQGYLTGFGSTSVDCAGGTQVASYRDGTITVAATNASTFTTKMVGGGEEGLAYAVSLPSIKAAAVAVSGSDNSKALAGSDSVGHSTSFSQSSTSTPFGTSSFITAGLLAAAAAGFLIFVRRRRHSHN